MPVINPYLLFNGTCEEAFEFYKAQFGGDFEAKMRMNDMDCGQPVPPEATNMIMHVALPIGNGNLLMGSDAPEGFGPPLVVGNNFSVSVSTDTKEEADRLFDGLSAGGSVTMPMSDAFWGSYFGMLADKFGVHWMISFDQKPAA